MICTDCDDVARLLGPAIKTTGKLVSPDFRNPRLGIQGALLGEVDDIQCRVELVSLGDGVYDKKLMSDVSESKLHFQQIS